MGAGGTSGGNGRFLLGLTMTIGGLYLMLNAIHVDFRHGFFGMGLFSLGGFNITSGYVLIGFMFGIGMMFYNSKNPLGWFLVFASLVMLIFGVITSANFRLRHMTSFDLLSILILLCGGLGLLLSSLRGR